MTTDPIRARLDVLVSHPDLASHDMWAALRAVLDVLDAEDALEYNGPMIYRSTIRDAIADALG